MSSNRDDILRRLERWVDEALSLEDPPAGVDAEILSALDTDDPGTRGGVDARGDAYSLWAAMTALTHEIKLQGRAFKELHTTLGAQESRSADEIRAAHREREREVQREAERRCRRDVLGALIDLRDRLGRGLDAVHAVESEMPRRIRRQKNLPR
jgi:hypothetical protein